MSPTLQKVLEWVIPIVTPFLTALLVQAIRYITAKMHLTMTDTQQKQLQFALEQGVLAAAERYGPNRGVGELKASFALDQAKQLAPDAMKKVAPEQQKVLVQASYAKVRPSLPAPSMFSLPGDDIPVDVVDLSRQEPARVTPIPPPKRIP